MDLWWIVASLVLMRLHRGVRPHAGALMSALHAIALIVAVLLCAYLIYALFRPERF